MMKFKLMPRLNRTQAELVVEADLVKVERVSSTESHFRFYRRVPKKQSPIHPLLGFAYQVRHYIDSFSTTEILVGSYSDHDYHGFHIVTEKEKVE